MVAVVGGARNPQAVRVRELRRVALADAAQATLEVAVVPRLPYLALFLGVQLTSLRQDVRTRGPGRAALCCPSYLRAGRQCQKQPPPPQLTVSTSQEGTFMCDYLLMGMPKRLA